jgi:TIR domain
LADGSLITIAMLGLSRAVLIWASDARLQPHVLPPANATRDAAIGLVFGQISGAALAWMLSAYVPFLPIEPQASHFVSWYLGCGLMLFGSAVGISAALWRHGLVKDTAIYWGGTTGLAGSATQIAVLALVGSVRSPFALPIALLPVTLFALLAGNFGRITAAQARALVIAWIILSLPAYVLLARDSLGILPPLAPGDSDWLLALPLVAAAVATWPLVQRVVTDEPSVANEPADWRPRPVQPLFWVFAPLVLLSAVQFSIGVIAIDLPSFVIPLSILLAWRFGLRGFRTVMLMVLPALWFYVPLLLTFAPLQDLLPEAQFALPQWVAPVPLDVAASALLIAALFARPALFLQIRTTSQLPLWGIVALVLTLCVQVGAAGNQYTNERIFSDQRAWETQREMTERLRLNPEFKGFFDIQGPADTSRDGPGGANARDKASTTQAEFVGRAQKHGAMSRSASSYGWSVPLGWSPSTILVLALFLLATTQVRGRAVFILLGALTAGVVAFLFTANGIRFDTFRPLSNNIAWGALTAYGVGLYFRGISIESAEPTRHMPFKFGDYMFAGLLSFLILAIIGMDFVAWQLNDVSGDLLLVFSESRATTFALAMLLTWMMGVRVGNSVRLRNAGFVGFLLLYLVRLLLLFLFLSEPSFVLELRTPEPLLAPSLLLALFIVGVRCRNAVVRPQAATVVAIRKFEWLTTLRQWSASIRERVQLALQDASARVASLRPPTRRANTGESTPGAAGPERPTPVDLVNESRINEGANANRGDSTSENYKIISPGPRDEPPTIFISYARDDDLSPGDKPDGKGFVAFLDDALRYEFGVLGPERPKIWLDTKRIAGGDQFASEIEEALKNASLLLVILSPNWIANDWCRRELDTFAKYHGPYRLRERIVIVGKRHVDSDKRPTLLQGQKGFAFYHRNEDPEEIAGDYEFFDRGEPRDARYWERLKALAAYLRAKFATLPVVPGSAI